MGARRRRITTELLGISPPSAANDEESGGWGGRSSTRATGAREPDTTGTVFVVLACAIIGIAAVFAIASHAFGL